MTSMKRTLFFLAPVFALLGIAVAADTTGIKVANLKDADLALMNDHDPASELANFEFLPGYQANLFASEPMIANPVHMHWDSRGRLWVACSWAYPQLEPGDEANDKIIILEDTDGDGAADKSTVFADGLYVPTGIELANGGCYVGQSPDVFFLKDTDGDDVADVKELALTGFGIEDSHHSISAWRRGPGGWIYFQEGIFLHAQVETQYGVVRNFNGGVYQFNPRTQELRVFCTGTGGNPWGHVFDRWGQSFMVNNPRIMYLSPATGNSGEKIQVKSLISTEKQCGGDLATGTHIGDELRGQLLSGRFKSRAVIRYEFLEEGAGFSANVLEPLMKSKHPNFRPVDVKMGPDGAIYVADWYNSIINHAQHDFRDPRRDHSHGRIWRITHKDRPLVEKPELVGRPTDELVDQLRSSEAWTRHQARKELSERDPEEVRNAAENWVARLDSELPDYDHHLVEAMWACQNVDEVSEPILKRVLAAEDGRARSAGARMIRYWHLGLSDPIALLAEACGDSFPRTRMEAVLSAGYVPQAEAFAAALHSLDHAGDPVLDQALPQTRKALEPYWRPALEEGTLVFAKESHEAFARQEAGLGFSQRLTALLEDKSPDPKEIAGVKEQMVAVGTGREIKMVTGFLSRRGEVGSPELAVGLLEALASMSDAHSSNANERSMSGLRRLLRQENDEIASLAAENLGAWGVDAASKDLVKTLEDSNRSFAVREAAASALAGLGTTDSVEKLVRVSREADTSGRYAAAIGIARADLDLGIETAIALLQEDPGDADPARLVQAVLRNRKGGNALAAALDGITPHPAASERVTEFHRQSGQLPEQLAKLFQPSNGTESLSRLLLAEDRDALVAAVEAKGDPHLGEMIYRRRALACTTCHAIGSAGPSIGPNLVAVGAAATTEYMVEAVLEPNASIAEHYENRLFILKDGSVQAGVVTFKSEKEVVVRDSAQAGKEVRIAAENILKEQAMPSLMPAGLADQLLGREEFLHLARFLSVLGRPGEFANDESPVIRKWQIAFDGDGENLPDDEAGWMTVYSKVNGELPSEDLGSDTGAFARGFVNVQVAGAVALKINDGTGIRLWIDGEEVSNLAGDLPLNEGRRVFTFRVDPDSREGIGLRVELAPAANSSVKFQPEGGL